MKEAEKKACVEKRSTGKAVQMRLTFLRRCVHARDEDRVVAFEGKAVPRTKDKIFATSN